MADMSNDTPVLPIQHFRMALRTLNAPVDLVERILDGSGIVTADLEKPNFEMPVSAIWPICDNVAQIFGDDWFFRQPILWSLDTHSELGMAMRFAPDFGTAIDIVSEFTHVRWSVLRLLQSRDQSNLILTILPMVRASPTNWQMANSIAWLSFQATAKAILSHGAETIRYQLMGPPPGYGERLLELFEGNASWGHERATIIVPRVLCKQVSPLTNSTSFTLVLAALREIAMQKGQINNLKARVSETLDGVTRGRVDAVDVARKMGMSKRTFERRLSGEGSNFRDLVNESNKKRLEHLLLDTRLTAEAIADRLGYHDASSLLRACRRLYGIPYSQLRRQVRAKQAR
jgi:AraC-like DNA-binding protein